jgi:nicotinamidase-related amidase
VYDAGVSNLALSRAALVISECQRGFVEPSSTFLGGLVEEVERRQILPLIRDLASSFRAAQRPVIHCTVVHRPGTEGTARTAPITRRAMRLGVAIEGDPSAEIVPILTPEPGDVVSNRASGATIFFNTDLDSILRVAGIESIVLVGVSTNLALFAGSVEATNRNYRVVIPEDCTAGGSRETHEMMVQHFLPLLATITTAAAVEAALDDIDHTEVMA